MTCSEWWAFEILTLLASILSTKAAAVQSILMQTISLTFMIPLGIGIACTSLVGNAIGANCFQLAKSIGNLSIELVLVVQSVLAITLWYGGETIIHIFSQDEEVITMASQAMPYLSIFIILDGLQCIISSILRGTGKQFIGAVINVVAYYGVGLPLAYLLCFHWHYGLNGLLLGITTGGSLLQCIVLVACIYNFERFMYSVAIHSDSSPTSTEKKYASMSYQALSRTEA
jgi:MATE family multidrug resistance protein